jgi:geranyl-CoA carboxylase alpha subunit
MSKTVPIFNKILVANRGEIALRIMRTAKAKGLHTIAVYSEADKNSPHVRFADQAWCLGGAAPKDSYLNIEKVIAVAKKSAAQAIHPGYGFLAENPAFAAACIEAGLVFIGPSPAAIATMGDKAKAKQLMRNADVPCIPGYEGTDQSDALLAKQADSIGYPVMIKASAGGGGRGMRLVHQRADFAALLTSAKSEAMNAFGDATVLLEKAVVNPRHIEIQIVADRFGNVIHLGERDCSIQRRHQKIIEEAPSPAVNDTLRNEMGAIAVKATKAIQYEGVGTFEFLLDENGKFYFMEMNTRLQVEHPVTEAITGLDLVAMQIDIANGLPLALSQEQVKFNGHAIEVRLCAEDVATGFTPQSGTLLAWQAPSNLRIEHALESGCSVTPYYDSMIAKLISHSPTRNEARNQLAQGLYELVALGIPTNQDFLMACLHHRKFAQGDFSTAFIEEQFDPLNLNSEENESLPNSVVAAGLLFALNGEQSKPSLHHQYPASLKFTMKKPLQATILQTRNGLQIQSAGVTAIVDIEIHKDGLATISNGEHYHCIQYIRQADLLHFRLNGRNHRVLDQRYVPDRTGNLSAQDNICRASTNGKVVAVHVAVGQEVEVGQALFTLEAMKMEHVHVAKVKGIIETIGAGAGEQVKQMQLLVTVKGISRSLG